MPNEGYLYCVEAVADSFPEPCLPVFPQGHGLHSRLTTPPRNPLDSQ